MVSGVASETWMIGWTTCGGENMRLEKCVLGISGTTGNHAIVGWNGCRGHLGRNGYMVWFRERKGGGEYVKRMMGMREGYDGYHAWGWMVWRKMGMEVKRNEIEAVICMGLHPCEWEVSNGFDGCEDMENNWMGRMGMERAALFALFLSQFFRQPSMPKRCPRLPIYIPFQVRLSAPPLVCRSPSVSESLVTSKPG